MKNKHIGLDTNVFIYYFHQHPELGESAKFIFSQLITNKAKASTSVITSIELLSINNSDNEIATLKSFLLQIPNLAFHELTIEIGYQAARIRRSYGFSLPDSIQLATALTQKADTFITNDKRLKKFKELEVVLLEEFGK